MKIKRIKVRVKPKSDVIAEVFDTVSCSSCKATFNMDTAFDSYVGDYYLYKCPNCGTVIELSKRVPTLNFKGAVFGKFTY